MVIKNRNDEWNEPLVILNTFHKHPHVKVLLISYFQTDCFHTFIYNVFSLKQERTFRFLNEIRQAHADQELKKVIPQK